VLVARLLYLLLVQLHSSLYVPPLCLPGARRATAVGPGGVLSVGRSLLDAPASLFSFRQPRRLPSLGLCVCGCLWMGGRACPCLHCSKQADKLAPATQTGASKCKAALCTPICPASAMAAPTNATSNDSDFRRRNGIAQALRNKIIQLHSGLYFPPLCLPGARRATVWPVRPGGVLSVGRPLLDTPAPSSQCTSVHPSNSIPRCHFFVIFNGSHS
jgi:hypothetical protein